MRATEFVLAESRLFNNSKTKNAVYNLVLQATGGGPFDGGCVVFAQALQLLLGGDIVVLVNNRDQAEHAAVKSNNQYWDFDGPASEQGLIQRFNKSEHRQVTGIRPIQHNDLDEAPRDPVAAAEIARLLAPKLAQDQELGI